MPKLDVVLIKELMPVSILVITKELSLDEQVKTNGQSFFIYLSKTISSINEFEFTV